MTNCVVVYTVATSNWTATKSGVGRRRVRVQEMVLISRKQFRGMEGKWRLAKERAAAQPLWSPPFIREDQRHRLEFGIWAPVFSADAQRGDDVQWPDHHKLCQYFLFGTSLQCLLRRHRRRQPTKTGRSKDMWFRLSLLLLLHLLLFLLQYFRTARSIQLLLNYTPQPAVIATMVSQYVLDTISSARVARVGENQGIGANRSYYIYVRLGTLPDLDFVTGFQPCFLALYEVKVLRCALLKRSGATFRRPKYSG